MKIVCNVCVLVPKSRSGPDSGSRGQKVNLANLARRRVAASAGPVEKTRLEAWGIGGQRRRLSKGWEMPRIGEQR